MEVRHGPWILKYKEEDKCIEMNVLRGLCGLRRIDRVTSDEI